MHVPVKKRPENNSRTDDDNNTLALRLTVSADVIRSFITISVTHLLHQNKKKAFQSNANHPLADSPWFIVNKFDNVLGRVPVQ